MIMPRGSLCLLNRRMMRLLLVRIKSIALLLLMLLKLLLFYRTVLAMWSLRRGRLLRVDDWRLRLATRRA